MTYLHFRVLWCPTKSDLRDVRVTSLLALLEGVIDA